MNPNGNTSALKQWRATATPAELQAARQKAVSARAANNRIKTASATHRMVGITVQERLDGKYERGHSRTISIQGCPIPLDELAEWLETQLRALRTQGVQIAKTPKLLVW